MAVAMNSSGRPIVGDAGLHLELRTNLFLGTREMGDKILGYLVKAGGVFLPELFDGGELTNGRKVKLDPHDLKLPLDGWADHRYSLGIIASRSRPVKTSFVVSSNDFMMFDYLSLSIDSKWFADSERLEKFVTVAKDLYSITQANSGYIQNWRSERVIGETVDDQGNITGFNPPKVRWTLRGLFWANFFGPEYVNMFGNEKLHSAPWHKIEELPDGGLLGLMSESPFDAVKSEYQSLKKRLYATLGEAAFTGARLPEFRKERRKKRDARPLMQSGGVRDDVFRE
jgi:hypothetical protein